MNILFASFLLFVIGFIEYLIDQLQKIVLSRLKFFSTLIFQTLNKLFEAVVTIYVWSTIIDFWSQFKQGNHNFILLLPYFLYTIGAIFGTGTALFIYIRQRKNKDMKNALRILNKPNKKSKKKKTKKQQKIDAAVDSTPETILDPIEVEDIKAEIKERAIADATQQISDKVDQALNENN